jgi:hypothetical protein
MEALLSDIASVFAHRHHPGADRITRCAYWKVYGGSLDEPCWECQEMASHFACRSWQQVAARELRRYGDNDFLFTVPAYCYFLPAYLVSSISQPAELDVCIDHLEFRFGPSPDDSAGATRCTAICAELSAEERRVVSAYFEMVYLRDGNVGGFCKRALQNLK